jgi:tetratricopeptide (TPR) repeat protein
MKKILLVLLLILSASAGQSHAGSQPSPSQQCRKADALYASGKFSKALLAYQEILSVPSGKVSKGEIFSRIADCHFRLNDYQNALKSYESALKNQKPSEQAPTQYWIGFCSLLLGRHAEAEKEFLKIPERYPKSGMWVGTAYYWAGRAAERLGEKDRAAGHYRKAGDKGNTTQGKFAMKKAEAVKGK